MTAQQRMWPQALTEVSATKKVALGSIRHERSKVYKYVLYDEGTAALDVVAGDVVVYVAATGYTTNTVTPDASDGDGVGAGVILATVTDDAQYIWIQIKGPATLAVALTGGADGNALTSVGAADKTLDVSALVTDSICATAIDASAKTIACDFVI